MEKYKFLLLSATPYSMIDERTGAVNEGISINYLPTNSLAPCSDKNGVGHKPAKGNLPLELLKKIQVAPAIYDFSFDMRIVANKPMLKLVDVDYISSVNVTMFETGSSAEELPADKPTDTKSKEVTKKG